jgi:hypothetical protein
MTSTGDKKRFGRLWLLFALVATALVWTWGQVFEQSTRRGGFDGERFELLRTESGCDLASAPCAAYGERMALVASAKAEDAGVRWRVKLLGDTVPAVAQVHLTLRVPAAGPQQLQVLRMADEWQALSPGRVASGSILQVRLEGDDLPRIAEFPLRPAR